MPLYELLCISRHVGEYKHIKGLVTASAKHVMDAGGVVRNIDYWGTRVLPQLMRRQKQKHKLGDYWTMHFDTNPRVMNTLKNRLKIDPMVIRWTMTKLGEKPEDIVKWTEKTRISKKVEMLS
ncbi:hypothetical protein M422DRAFT_230554 [Sphaerobolus stellatus SS14]|uniref:Ribosomal protein S6 n=1 Tax=Sphaerobolus stellatus (strain SS14) TaxID=990650 RepID=A0A0C9VF04_SPHS4|nr:hypothetical protein M422DRAFT_230554 [Sphaerobolus stellatus SS14]